MSEDEIIDFLESVEKMSLNPDDSYPLVQSYLELALTKADVNPRLYTALAQIYIRKLLFLCHSASIPRNIFTELIM